MYSTALWQPEKDLPRWPSAAEYGMPTESHLFQSWLEILFSRLIQYYYSPRGWSTRAWVFQTVLSSNTYDSTLPIKSYVAKLKLQNLINKFRCGKFEPKIENCANLDTSTESRACPRATQQGCAKCGGTSPCQRSWHRKKFQRERGWG